MTVVLLTLRFALELALLVAFGIAGWRLGEGAAAQLALAIALPVAAGTAWCLFIAPKARVYAPLAARLTIELALFVTAAVVLWAADLHLFAGILLGGELVVLGTMLASGHRPGRDQRRPGT